MSKHVYDVLVVGAGISGINAAFRIQQAMPQYSYAILEGRGEIGGTWSFFKYPGIRSDSDLFTFGFPWDPWHGEQAIAAGPAILDYLSQVSARHGLDKHMLFNHKVTTMNWSSKLQRWKLEVRVNGNETREFECRYLAMGTGYYDYEKALEADIPGISNFKGQVVHPQFWPEDLDYTGKRAVIIGSGATAVTILPAMHEKVEHITMLQRSPGWMGTIPERDPINVFVKKYFPTSWSGWLLRLKYLLHFHFIYYFCMLFKESAKTGLRAGVAKELPPNLSIDPHFAPKYDPWEQRLCMTLDGDFFKALRSGKATIVTDTIDTVTEDGILLHSGQTLPADLIITATGLRYQNFGHAVLKVDGTEINLADKYMWRALMVQDVPNFFIYQGYTNASWTLGSDASARLVGRLLRTAHAQGASSITATVDPNSRMVEVPTFNLKSNYIKKAMERNVVPKSGSEGPWRPRKSYFLDSWFANYGSLTGLKME